MQEKGCPQGQPGAQYNPNEAPAPGYQPVGWQPGQPVYVTTVPQPQNGNRGFKARSELGCGITMTILALVLLILGIVKITQLGSSKFFEDFWGAGLFLITGIIGIAAGKTSKSGFMTASIVFSVLSSIVSGIAMLLTGLVASVFLAAGRGHSLASLIGISLVACAIFQLAVLVVAICQAAFCCRCCYDTSQQYAQPQENALV